MNILKHSIKKFIYGTLPYYFMKGYKPDSPYLKYYKYIRKHGYSRHLYEFKDEYLSMLVDVRKDENRNLYYVLKEDGKRLYFQRTTPPHKIQKYYRALMIEQDQRSAHHYFNNNKDVTGKVFVDVGCAEGYSSLEIIEEAKHVYLFEQNESWLEAIRATFEPWKDKVTIVQKYVSNRNSPKEQKLDDFFRDKPDEHLFIKMDIEGAERRALAGCEQLFRDCKKIDFAICTYHLHDDEEVISAFLDKHNCTYRNQKGFFRHKIRSVVLRGNKKVN